ncbi:hypothetical protein ACJZ2D_000200 [Fusarium nematophilum]
MFGTLKKIGQVARDAIQNAADQAAAANNQQRQGYGYGAQGNNYYATGNGMYGGQPNMYNQYPNGDYNSNNNNFSPRGSVSFSWGRLINPDKSPSPLFTRLIDAIFNFGDASIAPQQTGVLEPEKAAKLYEWMAYADSNNYAKSFLNFAVQNNFPSPQARQSEAMAIVWRVFELEYTTTSTGTPALTREGFRAAMLMDSLVDPVIQLKRFNFVLGNNHGTLIDPATGAPFPTSTIPADALPAAGDQETQRVQAQKMAAVSAEYLEYQKGMMAAQNFKHQMTMDGLTAGYWVPNPYGGYQFQYTGGMNW